MAHKKIQIGTQKLACFINYEDGKEKRGFVMTKSYKDENGNWKDISLSMRPGEYMIFLEMMQRFAPLAMPIIEFEAKPQEKQVEDTVGDDVPF